MAVIKTKTKFTKSKFTKNKYSTKKKNVSRMTKKMNVMKGGSGKKPTRKPGSGSMSRRRVSQNPPTLPPKQEPNLYASVNKNRQPQYTINSFNKIVKHMEGPGKYANTRTRKDRLTENQKQQIRNLNITENSKNIEQQIRHILVNSRGKSKFAPEAVRELMKQPSYLKSLANKSREYLNIAPSAIYYHLQPKGRVPQRPLPQIPTNNKPPPRYNVLKTTPEPPEPLYATL